MSRPPPGESGRLAFTTARIDVALRLVDLQGPLDGVFQSVGRFADSTRLDAGTVLEGRPARRIRLGPQRLVRVWVQPRWIRSSTADDAQGE